MSHPSLTGVNRRDSEVSVANMRFTIQSDLLCTGCFIWTELLLIEKWYMQVELNVEFCLLSIALEQHHFCHKNPEVLKCRPYLHPNFI